MRVRDLSGKLLCCCDVGLEQWSEIRHMASQSNCDLPPRRAFQPLPCCDDFAVLRLCQVLTVLAAANEGAVSLTKGVGVDVGLTYKFEGTGNIGHTARAAVK